MVKTLVVDNFSGSLTSYQFGDINSGRGYVQLNSGANPFVHPGQLTWNNASVQIDPNADVVTDLILAGKERTESGILYMYCIGHTGRLYKIQVNDPATYNPDYDNPVLLAALSAQTPTFTRGAFLDFFGSTERIYIGHDKGLTRINFDGTNETFVGVLGSWVQTVPRPMEQFVGKLYVGNGSNLAEIDSTATVTSYAKISPGFPDNTQVRDLDLSPDGNYLNSVVSRLPLYDVTSPTQETVSTANAESFIFKWNGVDAGYTTFDSYPSFSLTANIMFQSFQYAFGSDQYGAAVYTTNEKFFTGPELPSPLPNAVSSTGNLLTWMVPVEFAGVQEADMFCWGNFDFEIGNPLGYWDLFYLDATPPETDVTRVPFQMSVSNLGIGASSNNYTNNIFGTPKVYFSTLETSTSTTAYRFYKWSPIDSPDVPTSNALAGVYATQIQMFSKKVTIKQVRIYSAPWVAGNSFEIDLIGSTPETAMAGGTQVFTAGTNMNIGDDFIWYDPNIAPTYAVGLEIINLGETNHVINKIEIDYDDKGGI